jgi:hypothetical protein
MSFGLPPFEAEMRRRLWFHIVNGDFLSSGFTGAKPSMDLFLSDTRIPLNIEDQDLSPEMTVLPKERPGITSMVLRLIKCDCLAFFRKLAPNFGHAPGDILNTSRMTLREKDTVIDNLEDILESKYLRYCDPSNSLHCFASILARSIVCKMRLMAHNPRQFAERKIKVPQSERNLIFANGMKWMEYVNLMLVNTSLRKYLWQINSGLLWESLVYVLIETRQRKVGPEVDRIWELIGGVFSNYNKILILSKPTEPLYAALGDWVLKVWDECFAARAAKGLITDPEPTYITAIRESRKPTSNATMVDPGTAIRSLSSVPQPKHETVPEPLELIEHCDFTSLLSFDLEPNELLQWDKLFDTEGGFL